MNIRNLLRNTVALAIAAAASSASAAETFDLDPTHCSIVFSVSHMSRSYTSGIFRQAKGTIVLDRQNPAGCKFRIEIPTDSIDTNNPQRDQHLKSQDFFNVAQFPTITFESTNVTAANAPQGGVVYQVTGNLTMHGVTKSITFPLRMLGEGPGPGGRGYSAGFYTTIELKRSDFDMKNLLDMVGDAIGITVSFEAARQDAAAPPAR
jgi:polyisoprenoid-binding protein YceI